MKRVFAFVGIIIVIAFVFLLIEHRHTSSISPVSSVKTQQYLDSQYGYSFKYPSSEAIEAYSPQYVAIGTSNTQGGFDSIAEADVALADASTSESFPDFAHQQAQIMCDADGPTGSVSCPSITSATPFTSASGIAGEEFYLTEVTVDSSGATTSTSVGPFFSFDISANVPEAQYAALIIHVPVPQDTSSTSDVNTVESIASSVQTTRVSQ